jgi:hypothetical protein
VPFDERAAAYVVMDPATAETFLNDFTQIAAARGLSPNYGRADRSDGRTLHVVEASGRALVVWVQNMPLSERQCPEMAGIDAGQFSLNVRPAMWFPFPGSEQYRYPSYLLATCGRRVIGLRQRRRCLAAPPSQKQSVAGDA